MSIKYTSFKDEVLNKIKEAEKNALEKVGFLVEAEAKLRTPVDTGTLKRSITHKVNDNEGSVSIGTNTEYSIYVEKGTSKMKAQPYLEPAVTENETKINSIIANEFKKLD